MKKRKFYLFYLLSVIIVNIILAVISPFLKKYATIICIGSNCTNLLSTYTFTIVSILTILTFLLSITMLIYSKIKKENKFIFISIINLIIILPIALVALVQYSLFIYIFLALTNIYFLLNGKYFD